MLATSSKTLPKALFVSFKVIIAGLICANLPVSTMAYGQETNTVPVSEKIKTLTIQRPDQPPTLILTNEESIDDLSREMLKTDPNQIKPYQGSGAMVRVLTDEPVKSTDESAVTPSTMQSSSADGISDIKNNEPGTASDNGGFINRLIKQMSTPLRWPGWLWWLSLLIVILIVSAAGLYYRAKKRKQNRLTVSMSD